MKRILKSTRGISLIELMVALIVSGILATVIFRIYVNQHHNWIIQDSVIEMQQNARAAIDELTRQLRQAGYQLPKNLAPLEAYNTDPDTVVVFYNGGDCDTPIEHGMPQPSAELRCDGHDVSCYSAGQVVYIWDPFDETGEFFEISQVQTASSHIQHNDWPLSKAYPKGSVILALDRVKFYIDQSDTLHPKLMVKFGDYPAQIYAEDIIDLQFNYRLKNGMTVAVPSIPQDVREVSIDLTARTQHPDISFPDNPYRFESYGSRVFLRNLGS